MNGVNNQVMLGADPFRPELTQRQESSDRGSIAKTFVKIILTIVVIGIAILMLPIFFCLTGMIVLSVTQSTIWGIIFGAIAVIGVVVLAIFLIRGIFKKK